MQRLPLLGILQCLLWVLVPGVVPDVGGAGFLQLQRLLRLLAITEHLVVVSKVMKVLAWICQCPRKCCKKMVVSPASGISLQIPVESETQVARDKGSFPSTSMHS